jgi:hypothetical protein
MKLFYTKGRQKTKGATKNTMVERWYKSRRQRYISFLVSTIGWCSVVMLGLCASMLFYILAVLILSL